MSHINIRKLGLAFGLTGALLYFGCAVVMLVARVKPGRILFELDGVPHDVARGAFERAAAKLPIKVKVVVRLGEPTGEAAK